MSDIRVPPQAQAFHPLADDLEALPRAGGGVMNESQLVQAIKVHIAKGDKAADKADQHYRSAGQHLKTLKAAHVGSWAEWEALLKTKVGIGKSRASELMRIADGAKTVEQVRAESAERKAKERAKSLRDVTEKSVTLPSLGSEDNAGDPELSTEAMKGGPELNKTVEAGKSVSAAVDRIRSRSPRLKSARSHKQREPLEKGNSLAEITRRIKLDNELSKIKNSSLDTPAEKDALIELKQLDESCAAKLVSRAAQGEAVSAAAEIDKRKFKPRPDAAKLMEVFNRHLLRVWVRATPAERRQWLKNLEKNVDLDALPAAGGGVMRAGTPIGATLAASMPSNGVCADVGGGRAIVPVIPPGRPLSEVFIPNVAQAGDALALLRSLPNACTPLAFFDPQFRELLANLKYGNEGVSRQSARANLPAMTPDYIDAVVHELARVLKPSGYLMRWTDKFCLCEGRHLNIPADTLKVVDLIVTDNARLGMGYRARCRGDFLLALQKPPIKARATWTDHAIPDRWIERTDRKLHPHVKPIGLITRLIAAVTQPGDLVVDPAAGSFVVMHAAHELGRNFIGVDIAYGGEA